jgi:flavin-binding protein dodecin
VSVYRVTEVIGSSPQSWEDAAKEALSVASRTLRDLRVAEVVEQDIAIDGSGGVEAYRVKLRISFKYEVLLSGASDVLPPPFGLTAEG